MDRNETKTHTQPYGSLDQFIKDGCRLNQMQFEKELKWAEQRVKELSRPSDSQRSFDMPQQNGFQDMLEKLKERGITPKVTEDFEEESQQIFKTGNFWEIRKLFDEKPEKNIGRDGERNRGTHEHRQRETEKSGVRKRRVSPLFNTIWTVAAGFGIAVAVFMLKPGIDAVGRKNYEYHRRIRNEEKGDIVWNNQEDYLTELGHLEKAYQKIKDELGIAVLKLNYIPEDIILSKVTIEDRHARLEFVTQDSFLYVLEVIYPVDDSANRFSDRVEYKQIYNEWMGKWIFIQRNQLEEDLVEYNAYFEHENAYYYLQGIIDENEFICILEDLTLEVN